METKFIPKQNTKSEGGKMKMNLEKTSEQLRLLFDKTINSGNTGNTLLQLSPNIELGDCQSFLKESKKQIGIIDQTLSLVIPNYFKALILERQNPNWRWIKANGKVNWHYEKSPSTLALITGSSGSGKSTLAKSLLTQFANQGFKVIILDPHNEYGQTTLQNEGRCFSALKTSISLLELNGTNPTLAASEFVSIMRGAMPSMGDIQAYYLTKAALNAYQSAGIFPNSKSTWQKRPPSLSDVSQQISQMIETSKKPDPSLFSLKRRIDTLTVSGLFSSKTHLPFQIMLNQQSCFDLSQVLSYEAQLIYVEVFLRKLYSYVQLKEKNQTKILVVIDEAQSLCKTSPDWTSFAGKIYQGGRKFGLSMLLISQGFLGLDSAIPANSSALFSFQVREPKDLEYLGGLFCFNRFSEKSRVFLEEFGKLNRFECFFTCSTSDTIVKIKTGKTEQNSKKLTDRFVLGSMHQLILFNHIKSLVAEDETIRYNDWKTLEGYELDITFPKRKIALELDGAPFHSSVEQKAKDLAKDKMLEKLGWKIYRILDDSFTENQLKKEAEIFVKWFGMQTKFD